MSPAKYYFWKILLSTCTAPPKLTDRKVLKKIIYSVSINLQPIAEVFNIIVI